MSMTERMGDAHQCHSPSTLSMEGMIKTIIEKTPETTAEINETTLKTDIILRK